MKKILIVVLSLFTVGIFAQNTKNCVTPISNYLFQQKSSALKTQRSEARKLELAKNLAAQNCLSTSQVKEIASLFENDYNRLGFVQAAYPKTTDKDNFYEVYNTFLYFSTVFRLHDYIAETKSGSKVVITDPVNTTMTFPKYQYPDFRRYYGKIGCKPFLTEKDFTGLAKRVFNERTEPNKLKVAKNIARTNCMLTAQAMKIASLLKDERSRLDFLKNAYYKVYDPDNYKYAHQVFNNPTNKKNLESFYKSGTNIDITKNDPPCEVNAQDFAGIKSQIRKQSFNNTKVNLAKQILRAKKCFKTQQIIELIGLFTYSSSKMDIAKFAYQFTSDKNNYYRVADSFSFDNDKKEILEYTKGR